MLQSQSTLHAYYYKQNFQEGSLSWLQGHASEKQNLVYIHLNMVLLSMVLDIPLTSIINSYYTPVFMLC